MIEEGQQISNNEVVEEQAAEQPLFPALTDQALEATIGGDHKAQVIALEAVERGCDVFVPVSEHGGGHL